MKEKIIKILRDNKEWESSLEYTADELLGLFSVRRSYSFEDMERAYEEGVYEGTLRQMNKEKNSDKFIHSDLKYYMKGWG